MLSVLTSSSERAGGGSLTNMCPPSTIVTPRQSDVTAPHPSSYSGLRLSSVPPTAVTGVLIGAALGSIR